MGMSSPRAGRGHKLSRDVQVSRPLLELRGGHAVVLQMKVPQVALIRQLVDNVAESFTFCPFLPQIEASSAHPSALTPLVPVWQLGLAILAVLFSFALVQLDVISEEPRVQGLRHQQLGHAFPPQVLFLVLAVQEVGHLHHQRQRYDLAAQGVYHLRLHACVHELDMLGFRSDMAKVTCLLG